MCAICNGVANMSLPHMYYHADFDGQTVWAFVGGIKNWGALGPRDVPLPLTKADIL